jgi:NitT/TauT family transport system ATP-binding protein
LSGKDIVNPILRSLDDTTTEPGPAFQLQNVGVHFSGSDHSTLTDFSLSIFQGEFVSIVGPSGCGKSTLLKLIAELILPTAGSLTSTSPTGSTGSTNRIGFVFQHPTLLPWRTAADNLRLPSELGKSSGSVQLSDADCADLLEQVGLQPSDLRKRPSELSGGMQMRLSLARALATGPDVLLLDEPFAAVDDLLRLRLQEDVRRLHEQRGLTTILVTHNLHEAVFLSDRVIVLSPAPARILSIVAVQAKGSRNADFRESQECFAALKSVSAALFRQNLGMDHVRESGSSQSHITASAEEPS